jgi:glycine cleavage system H protein
MKTPNELYYTEEHEWLSFDEEQGVGTVGITDYAQGELGDVVFVELPEEGQRVEAKEPFGTIEAVKAVSELFAPVTGKVVEVNRELESSPELVNSEPYSEGWMIKVKLDDAEQIKNLLSAAEYEKHVS